jgi:hypothetical protein
VREQTHAVEQERLRKLAAAPAAEDGSLGMGNVAAKSNAKPLPAGSFFAFAPGMAHYAFTDEETVVQINSTGPWGVNYVNPKDDPRQKPQ